MTIYKQSAQTADGTNVIRRESTPGYLVCDEVVTDLPTGNSVSRSGVRSRIAYTPEPKQVFDHEQFGSAGAQKYYDPNYRLSIDYFGYLSVAQRRKMGINGFNGWCLKPNDRADLQDGEGIAYYTENFLGSAGGASFHLTSIQEFLNRVYYNVPALGYGNDEKFRFWIMNLESCVYLDPGNSQDPPYPGYGGGGYFDKNGGGNGPWENWKNIPLQMELSSEILTPDQLASRGRGGWEVEMHTRRANRIRLLLEICKHRSKPGTKVSIGTPMFVGLPRLDFENGSGYFMDGYCHVEHIGGDSQGNLTLNVPGEGPVTFKFNNDAYTGQDFNQGYWYNFDNGFDPAYETRIFADQEPALMNYPAIWSHMKTIHVAAEEKGYWQENRRLSQVRQGYKQPQRRQVEPMYEFGPLSPLPELQNLIRYNNPAIRGTPKLWQPPYEMYSRFQWSRFLSGDEADSGFYIFPDEPPTATIDLATDLYFNHHYHTLTAILQARRDMQPYETYYPGSVLVEDPEVKVNQAGDFQLYNGVAARAYNGGVQGTMRPAFSLRYKLLSAGYWVLVIGGMKQEHTEESTHLVRVPGSGVNNSVFRMKLRGPASHVAEFFVPLTDQNQTFPFEPIAVTGFEKVGYTGTINTVTS